MIKKMRPRYYCDFCKKSGGSAPHMKKHESRCTANPNRTCGMCLELGLSQKPIKNLIEALGNGDSHGLEKLRDLAEGCPVCTLAAIRQSGLQHPPDGESLPDGTGYYDPGIYIDYNFKEEMDEA